MNVLKCGFLTTCVRFSCNSPRKSLKSRELFAVSLTGARSKQITHAARIDGSTECIADTGRSEVSAILTRERAAFWPKVVGTCRIDGSTASSRRILLLRLRNLAQCLPGYVLRVNKHLL